MLGGRRYEMPGNENNLHGYSVKELYVAPRFSSYKEEIIQNLGDITEYQHVVIKAKELLKSVKVKAMRVAEGAERLFKYGIDEYTPLSIHHIISLILFTDYSEYRRKFKQSFCKLSSIDTLQDAKTRNANFHYQSRYFRESVECYGVNIESEYGDKREPERGPYYASVPVICNLPQFVIRLNGPTSTTKDISVCMNYMNYGMILELNNNGYSLASYLPVLDLSWISKYPDESERAMVGGYIPIRLQSIYNVNTQQQYKKVVDAMFILDAMTSGIGLGTEAVDTGDEGVELISSLFSEDSPSGFDSYTQELVKQYIETKKNLVINIAGIKDLDEEIIHLMMQDKLRIFSDSMNIELGALKLDNMLSPKIFELFEGIENITIDTTGGNGKSYPFDLIKFLEVICVSSSLSVIKIKETIMGGHVGSWLQMYWMEKSSFLVEAYKNKGFKIMLNKGLHQNSDYEPLIDMSIGISRI